VGACSHTTPAPVEVLGPTIDTHRDEHRLWPKLRPFSVPVSAPIPKVKPDEPVTRGSDVDLQRKLDYLRGTIRDLDNRLRPNWMESVPGQPDYEGDNK